MFNVYDDPESPMRGRVVGYGESAKEGGVFNLHDEPESPNEDEPESPNEGACLR